MAMELMGQWIKKTPADDQAKEETRDLEEQVNAMIIDIEYMTMERETMHRHLTAWQLEIQKTDALVDKLA